MCCILHAIDLFLGGLDHFLQFGLTLLHLLVVGAKQVRQTLRTCVNCHNKQFENK